MAILVFEHSDNTGIDRLGIVLRDYGHRLLIRRLHRGDTVPDDLDNVDGIISCGGPQSPLDDSLAWLTPQMDRIREADAVGIPVLGLCLGCEIVARALGGEVAPMDAPEIGWHEVALTNTGRDDPLHTGLPWRMTMPHWHAFHIAELPDGAKPLASSERTKVQAWFKGLRTYGFQYHPEMTDDRMAAWAAAEPDAVQRAGTTIEDLRAQTEANYGTFVRLTQRLFESIALFQMPVDRRYQGLAEELVH